MAIITKVVWGRELTEAEVARVTAESDAQKAAGNTDGAIYSGSLVNGTVRIWTNTDAANAFIAFENTFSPAPTSAQVL